MNLSTTGPDPNERILAQILRELEELGADAPEVNEYMQRYPALADEIRELFGMQQALDLTRSETGEAIPARLGDFRIVRKIAGGGMGEIFEAVQEPFDRRVAVKTIRQGRVSPQARERFLREQQVLARLHQTHIVPVHAAGEEGTLQYFAMPFITGATINQIIGVVAEQSTAVTGPTPTLRQLAAALATKPVEHHSVESAARAVALETEPNPSERQPLSEPRLSAGYFRSVAEVMVDAATALQHAHDVNVLHRDLKPSNLMVDSEGHCWIIDFGLAGYLSDRKSLSPNDEDRPDLGAAPHC